MIVWVEQVLCPYIETAPAGILSILFLDSYRCHMMAAVVGMIQDLGVEVNPIARGCTWLCQPVDIGVNKLFKNLIRQQWEEWMVAEGLVNGTTSQPTREHNWINSDGNKQHAHTNDTKCMEAWLVLLVSASSCSSTSECLGNRTYCSRRQSWTCAGKWRWRRKWSCRQQHKHCMRASSSRIHIIW